MLSTLNLILGAALLVAGRKLFWLFIGIIGFITGLQLAQRFINGPDWMALLVGVIVGIIFALLAVFIEALAIGIAGFLAGGYILTSFTSMFGLNEGLLFWVIYAIGGLIGLLLVMFLFDWALIVLSSLAGASLIVQSLPAAGSLLFLLLVIAGIVIQGMILYREGNPPVRRYRRVRRVRRVRTDND